METFYPAISKTVLNENLIQISQTLVVKKLRYYARFIVVCLLLDKRDIVKQLLDEMTFFTEEYTRTFQPKDAGEWQIVLREVTTFLEVTLLDNI